VRVSFDFGPVLACWHDRKGTQYTWSLIPLGGYVKRLDETHDPLLPHERHLAFSNKPVIVRMLIVIAGPLSNFIFSFIVLWLVLVVGTHSLAPIIDNTDNISICWSFYNRKNSLTAS
jgi:regulator of sigma E protease